MLNGAFQQLNVIIDAPGSLRSHAGHTWTSRETKKQTRQDHHHNGDQAARRPHMLGISICVHSFGGVDESCTIVYGINSEPENVLSNVLY